MIESRVEEYLKTRVQRGGGLFYKFTSPGNIGVPDRIIVTAEGRTVFVELKQEHGRLSPIQKVQIDQLRKHHADVRVVYGKHQAELLADELFGPEPKGRKNDAFGIEEWR